MVAASDSIMLFVHDLAHTGVVRNTLAVAEALTSDCHRVQIVTALPGRTVPDGVEHVALLGAAKRRRRLEQLLVIPALRRHLRRERSQLVISMGNHSHAVMWVATIGLGGVRRVFRISNDLIRTMPGAPRGATIRHCLRRLWTRLLVRTADALILVSPSLLDDPALAAAHSKGKATIIANGVDIEAARHLALEPSPHPWLEGDQPTVLAIGRLAAQKNFSNLLRAVALLNRQRSIRLIVLGESRDTARAELIGQAEMLGIGQQVLLPGVTDNVFAWLTRADVFALPSWWEGSPNVLLEAMAVGTPVITSRTAGNAADIVGDTAGYLVDPADPRSIAAAILRQLDPATRVAPADRANEFDLEATLAAWRAFVRNLVHPLIEPLTTPLPTSI